MADARLDIQSDGAGADLCIEGGDLALDLGLATPTLVSLFSDGRAVVGDPRLDSEDDPRGWSGDTLGERVGSRLWLVLDRAKLTSGTLVEAEAAARDALAWMLRDGIARDISVTATRRGDRLDLLISITKGTAARWQALWDGERSFDVGEARVRLLTR